MKSKTTVMSFLFLILTAGCSFEENNEKETNLPKDEIISVKSTEVKAVNRDCFDAKMEKWFAAFNDYQQQGLKMNEADKKASEDADRVYNECLSGTALADNSESSESEK